jgi:hypothetical protein
VDIHARRARRKVEEVLVSRVPSLSPLMPSNCLAWDCSSSRSASICP